MRTCVYMYLYVCVYFLSFINVNILFENLQTLNNFINHLRLFKASLIYFVLLIQVYTKNLNRFNIGLRSIFFPLYTSLDLYIVSGS